MFVAPASPIIVQVVIGRETDRQREREKRERERETEKQREKHREIQKNSRVKQLAAANTGMFEFVVFQTFLSVFYGSVGGSTGSARNVCE